MYYAFNPDVYCILCTSNNCYDVSSIACYESICSVSCVTIDFRFWLVVIEQSNSISKLQGIIAAKEKSWAQLCWILSIEFTLINTLIQERNQTFCSDCDVNICPSMNVWNSIKSIWFSLVSGKYFSDNKFIIILAVEVLYHHLQHMLIDQRRLKICLCPRKVIIKINFHLNFQSPHLKVIFSLVLFTNVVLKDKWIKSMGTSYTHLLTKHILITKKMQADYFPYLCLSIISKQRRKTKINRWHY